MRLLTGMAAALCVSAATLAYSQAARADTTCRENCDGGVCRSVCYETEGRGDRDDDRSAREERRDRREEREERRDNRDPAIELRVPGVGVEIGR
jgi:hypothetical protein